jgi:tRNA pseudouridine synthase 10
MKGVGSFCISTIIPKEWLINEEEAWDRKMVFGSESIKNILNRKIVKALKDATGLRYDSADGDVRAVFDFCAVPKARVEIMPLFIFGRYRKHVTGLSQSRWLCATCEGKGCPSCGGKGKNYESVEERIGDPAKSAIGAQGYVMHASGREDVDATNSAGRAFVLEVKSPQIRAPDLQALAKEIGKSGEVSVLDLRMVRRADVELITESHFDKTYEAGVDFGRAVDPMADSQKIRSLEGRTILQQTPARVAHRRADLVRHRKIKHIEPVNLSGNKGALIIKAEAGTYIKELISSDNGRTKPSVAEVLGTSAVCTKLAVIEIDDGFLDFCLKDRKG